MNKIVMRSLTAIVSGWAVAFAGSIATMVIIRIAHPGSFRASEAQSTGSLLATLLISVPWSVIAGFVTGGIAGRNEVKHGIGLILFTLVVYVCSCLLGGRRSDAVQPPIWFQATWCILLASSVLLGAWLRMRRRTLPRKAPTGVAGAVNDLWLSIVILSDPFRFPIAIGVSIIIALGGAWFGTLLMGIGLLGVRDLLGLDHISPAVSILCAAISFSLSCMAARGVFRRIMRAETPLPKIAE